MSLLHRWFLLQLPFGARKGYTCILEQLDNSEPSPTEGSVRNTFGVEPIFQRVDVGDYAITMTGQFADPSILRIRVFIRGAAHPASCQFRTLDANTIRINTFNEGGDQFDPDELQVEIEKLI